MHVVTFYSYKGGVGRTLALLNVANELADSGQKVLVVDFDLEAPAIRPDSWRRQDPPGGDGAGSVDAGGAGGDEDNLPFWIDSLEVKRPKPDHPGIVEFVADYLDTMCVPLAEDYVTDATPESCQGEIHLMPAGRSDKNYGRRLSRIDWNRLYRERDGYVMFEDLRAQWEELDFDYVLLDSRTGLTDIGGICTRHLPDAVVAIFRPDDQSLRGTKRIVEAIRAEKKETIRRKHPIFLHFVMAGIPDADDEHGHLKRRRQLFRRELRMSRSMSRRDPLEVRHYQSMDLLTQPIYTDVRPRTRLAKSFQELARRIRARNPADKDGILEYLKRDPDPWDDPEGDHLKRIREDHPDDVEVIGELARQYHSRGQIQEANELLEEIARLGALTPDQCIRLADLRHATGERDGALEALHHFFRESEFDRTSEDRSHLSLVRRGLSLLEAMSVDCVPYVDGSPVVASLSSFEQVLIANRMDRSVAEQRVAIGILEPLSVEQSVEDLGPEWQLALARVAVGDFHGAAKYYESELRDAESPPVAVAFNLAMARWGATGLPDARDFARAVDILEAEDDTTWLDRNANGLQAIAVAKWFGNQPERAVRYLAQAEGIIRNKREESSCWSFTRVPRDVFLEHCEEIRRLFAGEDVKPAFMRLVDEASE